MTMTIVTSPAEGIAAALRAARTALVPMTTSCAMSSWTPCACSHTCDDNKTHQIAVHAGCDEHYNNPVHAAGSETQHVVCGEPYANVLRILAMFNDSVLQQHSE